MSLSASASHALAAPSSRRHARPQPSSRAHTVRCMAVKQAQKVGFRYDASNLRWVRDDRYIGVEQETMVKPKSGTPFTVWPVVHTALRGAGLKRVTAEKAFEMQQKQGWTIVDVRLASDFKMEHCAGAINAPLYRLTQGDETWDRIKKFVMGSLAMKATERDPDFVANTLKVVKKNQKIIVCCAIGGTLDVLFKPSAHKAAINDPDRAFGRESRSLKAAYELYQAGWSINNMVFMEGGLQQWRYQGYPTEP